MITPTLAAKLKHLPGKHPQKSHAGARGSSSSQRVWGGEPVEPGTRQLTKLQVGELGEQLAMKVLSDKNGVPFTTLNKGINNAPIDVAGDHQAVEVKTGLASNGKTAQHWRATIGQPGKAETELIKQMSKQEKREHHDWKREQIIARKQNMLKEMSAVAGGEVKPVTVGIILHPDGSKGDVYRFDGFHQRIPWNKAAEMGEYLGTYDTTSSE